MPTYLLTDIAQDRWTDAFEVGPADCGWGSDIPWSITKRTLRGGRRDGVDLIHLDNGVLSLDILPTRGMNLWRAHLHSERFGWNSPIQDGPVHPAHVNLAAYGGLGWVDGFDELLARCGLDHNGAPFEEEGRIHPLHGRISNLPAHHVSVHVEDTAPHTLSVEGHVDEARLFGPRLRLVSVLSTVPGSPSVTIRDTVHNLGDRPAELELLYHWNFGPPLLGEGARFLAPVCELVPRNPHAAADMEHYSTYGPPSPGLAERVYFMTLHGEDETGQTLAVLRNPTADRAVGLRFSTRQLPCFSLWKNTAGLQEGYVTGLEPATNYPNPKPYERQQGRVITLPPGGSHTAEITLQVATNPAEVSALEGEVRTLQAAGAPNLHPQPAEPFAPVD